jgi:dihydroflavonol-4-reductase
MKALVTGASGFVGSHLCDLLVEKNYEVRCLVRKTSNLRWLDNKPVELFDGSLNDVESLNSAVQGMDYIYHVGGLVAARNYQEFLKGNRDGTNNLLEATLANAPNLKRFLFLSSLAAVGPSRSLNEPVDENTEKNPITSYGKSKAAAEDEVIKMMDKLPITIVRPPAVYGPRDYASADLFKVIKTGIGTLIGYTPKYTSIIHVSDLVRGIVDAAQADNTIGQIYFVSSEGFYTWKEIARCIQSGLGKKKLILIKIPHSLVLTIAGLSGSIGKITGKPRVFNYEKGVDFIQNYWICSIDKAKRDFGFRPLIELEDGMKQTAIWYKEQGWI